MKAMELPIYLSRMFGSKPSVEQLAAELAKVEQSLAAAPARIARADAALKKISAMTDDEHAAAEDETHSARREAKRLEARVDEVRLALADAKRMEADAALVARRKAIQRRVDAEYPKHLTRLDAKMAEVAEIAAVMAEIEGQSHALNRELEHARKDPNRDLPEPVVTPTERYFVEPDIVIPATKVIDQKWMSIDECGRWRQENVFGEKDGRLVPTTAGAGLRDVERVIPERRQPGRRMFTPTASLQLPATRLGDEPYWPRRA